MNKARKPLSLLLALMMVLGLFAASPMTVLADDPGYTGSDPNATVDANAGEFHYACQTSGFYTITVTTTLGKDDSGTKDTGAAAVDSITPAGSGTVQKVGAIDAGTTGTTTKCVWYMEKGETYTVKLASESSLSNSTAKMSAKLQTSGSTSGTVSAARDKTVSGVVFLTGGANGAWYQAVEKTGSKVTTRTSDVSGYVNTDAASVSTNIMDGSSPCFFVPANSIAAMYAEVNNSTGTTTQAVSFTKVSEKSVNLHPTSATDEDADGNDITTTYLQITPTETGLYTFTSTVTARRGASSTFSFPTFTITNSPNGTVAVEEDSINRWNVKDTATKFTELKFYTLTRGTSYLITVTNNLDPTKYSASLSVAMVPHVKGTGTATMSNLSIGTNENGCSGYEDSFFMFTPSASGWYTFTSGQPSVIQELNADSTGAKGLPELGTPNLDTDPSKPTHTGWAANLATWGAYKAGASGYFQKGITYTFQVTPTPSENVLGKFDVRPVSSSITIRGESFPVLSTANNKVDVTLGDGAVGYAKFRPAVDTLASSLSAKAPSNSAINGITKIYSVKPASGGGYELDESMDKDNGTLLANTTYYIQVTSAATPDVAYPASKATVSLGATAGNGSTVKVVGATTDSTSGKPLGHATVMLGNEEILPEDDGVTFPLIPGKEYKITGTLANHYTRTVSYVAGEEGTAFELFLYPVPSKPAIYVDETDSDKADQAANYSFSATPPSGESNVINVKIGANFTKTDGGAMIGITVPKGESARYGWKAYRTNAAAKGAFDGDTSNPAKGIAVPDNTAGTSAYYIPAFGSSDRTAWIELTYNGAASNVYKVVYQLDLSNVTQRQTSENDVPTQKTDTEVNVTVTGDAYSNLNGVKADIDATEAYFDSAESGSMFDKFVSMTSNNSTLQGYQRSVFTELKKLFDAQNKAAANNVVAWENYKASSGTNIATPWADVTNNFTDIVIVPVLNVKVTDLVKSKADATKIDRLTFSAEALNRVLTMTKADADAAAATDGLTNIISNKNPDGTVRTVKEVLLATGKTATDTLGAEINALQYGKDSQFAVTVTDPVKVTFNGLKDALNVSGDSYWVLQTQGSEKYLYEVEKDSDEFVSAHGLSNSTFTVYANQPRGYTAFILRDTDQGPCKIWYATAAKAIADAENGDIVSLISGYDSDTPITATNNKANSFAVVGFNGANYVDLNTTIKVNGTTLAHASVVVPDANPVTGVKGAVFGSGAIASTKTVRTARWSDGTVKVSDEYAKAGQKVTVTLTPKSGVRVTGLNVTTNKGSTKISVSGSNNSWTFTMPTGLGSSYDYVTVTPHSGNSVIIEAKTGGTVTASSVKPNVGDTVTLTVKPNSGWSLSGLTAKNTTTGKSVSLSKSSDTKYTFTMVDGGVTVTPSWRSTGVYVNNSSSGKVTASDTEPATGERVMISVTPNAGKELSSIQVRTNSGDRAVTTWKVNDSLYAFEKPSESVTVTTEWRTASSALPYTDSIASWALPYVRDCYTENLMSGIGSTFSGGSKIDRASVWTILARINGFYPKTTGNPWYAESRVWSVDQRVSDGTSGGSSITREQLATMLYRFAGKPATSGSLSAFPDRGQVHTDWADTENAMKWCVEKGIMSGDNGRLKPQANATRYEVAKMISVFVDVTGK